MQTDKEQVERTASQANDPGTKQGIRITVALLIILMMLILAGFSWSVYREAQRLKALEEPVAAESSADQPVKQ